MTKNYVQIECVGRTSTLGKVALWATPVLLLVAAPFVYVTNRAASKVYDKLVGTEIQLMEFSRALEKYRVDHPDYPPPRKDFIVPLNFSGNESYCTIPLATDHFRPRQGGKPVSLIYYYDGIYMLASAGPDQDVDVDILRFIESENQREAIRKMDHFDRELKGEMLAELYSSATRHEDYIYDPTNGLISSGDIIRTSRGLVNRSVVKDGY